MPAQRVNRPSTKPSADGELQIHGNGRQDLRAREFVFREKCREFVHALAAGDVVPDAPDQEQPDEHPQQQQREIAEALRGVQEQEFPHESLEPGQVNRARKTSGYTARQPIVIALAVLWTSPGGDAQPRRGLPEGGSTLPSCAAQLDLGPRCVVAIVHGGAPGS